MIIFRILRVEKKTFAVLIEEDEEGLTHKKLIVWKSFCF